MAEVGISWCMLLRRRFVNRVYEAILTGTYTGAVRGVKAFQGELLSEEESCRVYEAILTGTYRSG